MRRSAEAILETRLALGQRLAVAATTASVPLAVLPMATRHLSAVALATQLTAITTLLAADKAITAPRHMRRSAEAILETRLALGQRLAVAATTASVPLEILPMATRHLSAVALATQLTAITTLSGAALSIRLPARGRSSLGAMGIRQVQTTAASAAGRGTRFKQAPWVQLLAGARTMRSRVRGQL